MGRKEEEKEIQLRSKKSDKNRRTFQKYGKHSTRHVRIVMAKRQVRSDLRIRREIK